MKRNKKIILIMVLIIAVCSINNFLYATGDLGFFWESAYINASYVTWYSHSDPGFHIFSRLEEYKHSLNMGQMYLHKISEDTGLPLKMKIELEFTGDFYQEGGWNCLVTKQNGESYTFSESDFDTKARNIFKASKDQEILGILNKVLTDCDSRFADYLKAHPEDWRSINSRYPDEYDPVWSPSGSEIVFKSWQGGYNNLWVMDTFLKEKRQITNFTKSTIFYKPKWSPDGSRLVYICNGELYGFDEKNKKNVRLSETSDMFDAYTEDAAWFPGGEKILAQGRSKSGSMSVLITWRKDTGNITKKIRRAESAAASPSGSKILFEDSVSLIIFEMNAGKEKKLPVLYDHRFSAGALKNCFIWSSDENKICIAGFERSERSSSYILEIVDLLSGRKEIVYRDTFPLQPLKWSENYISFLKIMDGDLYYLDLGKKNKLNRIQCSAFGVLKMGAGQYGQGFYAGSDKMDFPEDRPSKKLVCFYPVSNAKIMKELGLPDRNGGMDIFQIDLYDSIYEEYDLVREYLPVEEDEYFNISGENIGEAWICVTDKIPKLKSSQTPEFRSDFIVSPSQKQAAVVNYGAIRNIDIIPFELDRICVETLTLSRGDTLSDEERKELDTYQANAANQPPRGAQNYYPPRKKSFIGLIPWLGIALFAFLIYKEIKHHKKRK